MSKRLGLAGCERRLPAKVIDSELVIERSKTLHSSIRLSMLLAMLGVCVFLWGLGYKLSLYQVHTPSVHRIPEAKLLSRNEDPNATDSVRVCLPDVGTQNSGLTIIAALICIGSGCVTPDRKLATRSLQMREPVDSRSHASLTAFFFRPPPPLFSL